jgi:hapalindole-type alkaloid chlorinase
MRGRFRSPKDPFILKEQVVSYQDISGVGDAFGKIYNGELDVLIIQSVFPQDVLSSVVEQLDKNDNLLWSGQESLEDHRIQNSIFGVGIAPNGVEPEGPSSEKYLKSAARFCSEVKNVFGDSLNPIDRVQRILSAIAGGRNTRVPFGSNDQPYTPFTIRSIPPGERFGLHTGNFFYETSAYDRLREQLDTSDQISFFTPLRNAESGGELEIFNLRWGDKNTPRHHQKINTSEVEANYSSLLYDLENGEMIVFDGGRLYHRVNLVVGNLHRYTLGGFAALSQDRSEVLYWG